MEETGTTGLRPQDKDTANNEWIVLRDSMYPGKEGRRGLISVED